MDTAAQTALDAESATAAARTKILEVCGPALAAYGVDPAAASDDLDLRASGAIDSLGFIELVAELEEAFDLELDLEAIDPEELTVIGPFSRLVGGQGAAAAG